LSIIILKNLLSLTRVPSHGIPGKGKSKKWTFSFAHKVEKNKWRRVGEKISCRRFSRVTFGLERAGQWVGT
jgi:hypothetical protein